MKKSISLLFLLVALFTSQCVFVSCEKDDSDDYYAGESEMDYKPATYTIHADWDTSKVSGLTASEKETLEVSLRLQNPDIDKVFNTRVEAVQAFDEFIEELRKLDVDYPGLKAKFWLKRGNAIIKSATLTW